ncbi:aldo/keto reductase [Streptosporangium sp. 'caverna']|uniref:aldo/keto reductase n=1 Tax=Streptosporangium sp. 'caverna' TaxID=2202249 RepID=UPI000D7D282E|nr:aldo/keto reductase [Streptosporangium sp. 'caverna']AWS44619.1 aldo/keto reductase [Streptosporangium sp. 'caverna']
MSTPDTPEIRGTSTDDRRPGGAAAFAGRTVSRIGYGAMQLTRLANNPDQAVMLLRRAAELGIDHFDTAHIYGNGLVNDLIREAFRSEDDILISSKIGADADPDGPVHLRLAQRPGELRASVEDNLKSLGREQIAVMNLRRPDDRPGLRAEGDQAVDLDDQLAAMTAMRDEGKIGAIGLSNITLDGLRRAIPAGIVCVQNAYSLVDRRDEGLLSLCLAEGIAWVPFFPLGSAVPSLPKVAEQAAVRAAAEALGHSPSQVGLAWLLHRAPNVLLIPGTAGVEHLESNVAAGSIRLGDAVLAALDGIPGI